MRRVWGGLKFIGRWLGPALFGLGVLVLVLLPTPFLDLSTWPLLAGVIVSAIAWFFTRSPERKRSRTILLAIALTAFVFYGWRYLDDHRGYSYHQETVSLDNRGAHLVGTLYLPDRPGKVPGMVWVHGSGRATRLQFTPFVEHFARLGYAVYILDKRGVGESTGHYEGDNPLCPGNVDLLGSDDSAALSLLAKRPEVRADAVGFFGGSQAGWIMPRAAVLNGHAAFMLLLSGPTISAYQELRYENLRYGPPPNNTPSMLEILRQGGRGFPKGITSDQAYALSQKSTEIFPCPDFDPTVDLRALNIPGLWLLGDRDWVTPPGPTARKLDELRQLGKPYQYRMIPGANHAMILGPKKLVLDTIDTWLAQATKPAK